MSFITYVQGLKRKMRGWEKQVDVYRAPSGQSCRRPSSASEDRMVVGWEELQDLKGVWSELSRIWEQIDEMKDKPWLSVKPRKLRQQMDLLLNQLKDLPTRLWQYASYEYVNKLIQSFQKVNMLIVVIPVCEGVGR